MPGNEACFEVLTVGSGVKSVKKGDWVIAKHTGLGTWRTHLQVDEGKVMRVEREGLRSEQVGTVAVSVLPSGLFSCYTESIGQDVIFHTLYEAIPIRTTAESERSRSTPLQPTVC